VGTSTRRAKLTFQPHGQAGVTERMGEAQWGINGKRYG